MWLSLLKFLLEIISLGMALIINFVLSFYRHKFHLQGLEQFELNLKKINGSLFSAQSFDYKLENLKKDESLYANLMVTIPTVAIFIRTCYSEYGIPSTGFFILFIQIILMIGAIYFAYLKHKHHMLILDELKNIDQLNLPLLNLMNLDLSIEDVKNNLKKLNIESFNQNDSYYLIEKLAQKYLDKKSLF